MKTTQQSQPQPITRERWAEVVAEYTPPLPEPLTRRRHHRGDTPGSAGVTFTPDGGSPEEPIVAICNVLQISAEGLTLRSRQDIPPETQVAIDLRLGEQTLALSGQTVHSTGTVGAFKVGVKLKFVEPAAPGDAGANL